MNIEKMMHVANRAKTIGTEEGLALSNVVFAILFQEYRKQLSSLLPMDSPSHLKIHLETKDPIGKHNHEVDYDLLAIVAKGEDGSFLNSISTPISLLYSYTAIAAMKTAEVSRGIHHRRCDLAAQDRLKSMWRELLIAVPVSEIRECVLSCFDTQEVFSRKVASKLEELGVL